MFYVFCVLVYFYLVFRSIKSFPFIQFVLLRVPLWRNPHKFWWRFRYTCPSHNFKGPLANSPLQNRRPPPFRVTIHTILNDHSFPRTSFTFQQCSRKLPKRPPELQAWTCLSHFMHIGMPKHRDLQGTPCRWTTQSILMLSLSLFLSLNNLWITLIPNHVNITVTYNLFWDMFSLMLHYSRIQQTVK